MRSLWMVFAAFLFSVPSYSDTTDVHHTFFDEIDLFARIEFGSFAWKHSIEKLKGLTYLGTPVRSHFSFTSARMYGITAGLSFRQVEFSLDLRSNGIDYAQTWFELENGTKVKYFGALLIETALKLDWYVVPYFGVGGTYTVRLVGFNATNVTRNANIGPSHQIFGGSYTSRFLSISALSKYELENVSVVIRVGGAPWGSGSGTYEAGFLRFQNRSDVPDTIVDTNISANGSASQFFSEATLRYVLRGFSLHAKAVYQHIGVKNVAQDRLIGFTIGIGIPY